MAGENDLGCTGRLLTREQAAECCLLATVAALKSGRTDEAASTQTMLAALSLGGMLPRCQMGRPLRTSSQAYPLCVIKSVVSVSVSEV